MKYPRLGFDETFERLTTTIDTDLDWVRKHTRFGPRAAQWEGNGRDNGFLLRGTELREAVRWLEQAATIKTRQPTEAHEKYIRTSEEWEAGELERAQRQAKRFRRLSYALGALLLLAIAAADSAYWERTLSRAPRAGLGFAGEPEYRTRAFRAAAAQSVAVTWPWGHMILSEAEESYAMPFQPPT